MTSLIWILLYFAIGFTLNWAIMSENDMKGFSPTLFLFWPIAAFAIIIVLVIIAWDILKNKGEK